jgi:CheY-like chemotaxis protein
MDKGLGLILVVDDDEDDHDLIRSVCAELGVCENLKFFFSGDELVGFLRATTERPFMILCDIDMPEINGLDLREYLLNDKQLKNKAIPFVFFSTSVSDGQVNRAFDLSVHGFFAKGSTMQETGRKLKLIFDYWQESKHPNAGYHAT